MPPAGSYPKPAVFATLIPRDNLIVPTVTGNARQFMQTTTTPAASTRLDAALKQAAKFELQTKSNSKKASETSSNKLGDDLDAGTGQNFSPSILDELASTLGVSRKVIIGAGVALIAYFVISGGFRRRS